MFIDSLDRLGLKIILKVSGKQARSEFWTVINNHNAQCLNQMGGQSELVASQPPFSNFIIVPWPSLQASFDSTFCTFYVFEGILFCLVSLLWFQEYMTSIKHYKELCVSNPMMNI